MNENVQTCGKLLTYVLEDAALKIHTSAHAWGNGRSVENQRKLKWKGVHVRGNMIESTDGRTP